MSQLLTFTLDFIRRHDRFGLAGVAGLMIALVAGMGLCSLLILNNMATKGYTVQELEAQTQALVEEIESITMMNLEASSLVAVEEAALAAGMRPIADESVVYVRSTGTGFAQR